MSRTGLYIVTLIFVLLFTLPVLAVTPEELLENIYSRQDLSKGSYLLKMEVVVKQDGKVNVAKLDLYYYNQDTQMIIFTEPKNLLDNCFLVVGKNSWMYKKGLHQPLRISATQKIFGEASVSETAGLNYLTQYRTVSMNEEDSVFVLELEALEKQMAYQKVTLRIIKDTDGVYQLSEAVLRAINGQALRKLIYTDIRWIGDYEVATIFVENLLQQVDQSTSLSILSIEKKDYPKEAFQPEMMHRFKMMINE